MQPVKKCENNEYRPQSTIQLVNKRDGDNEGSFLNPDIFPNRMQQVKTEFHGYWLIQLVCFLWESRFLSTSSFILFVF